LLTRAPFTTVEGRATLPNLSPLYRESSLLLSSGRRLFCKGLPLISAKAATLLPSLSCWRLSRYVARFVLWTFCVLEVVGSVGTCAALPALWAGGRGGARNGS
jgi:hypothetical protein